MTNKAPIFLLVGFLFFLTLTAQEKKENKVLQFHLKFNDTAITPGKKYISKKQDTLQIDTFRFYVSDIQIHYTDNSIVQSKESHLIDLEVPGSQKVVIDSYSKKAIQKISFSIGVDSLSSVSGALSGDLDPAKGMYWAWQSGYINMKIEGKSSSCKTRKNQFHFHIGGYLKPNNALRIVEIPVQSNNDILLNVDVSALMNEVDLKAINSIMIPGKRAMELADYSTKMFPGRMKIRHQNSMILIVALFVCLAFAIRKSTPIYFNSPKNWPKPHYDFSKNPLTEEGFQLGRRLFYDPMISRDSTISCASCHLQATGFTHVDHDLSHGIEGRIGTRNSMALVNLAWSKDFLWDGGANHLDVQPLNPITSPFEMDETLEHVVTKLQNNKQYQQHFEAAFGTSKITGQLTLKALSQFMLMLQSSNSKYDQVMRHVTKFNESELNGYQLFQKKCASCHPEPLFTSGKFENNGLTIDTTLNDMGRMKITNLEKDYMRFKVPTLRNIQFTFPYMHDGRFKTLTEVVKHYNAIPKGKNISKDLEQPMQLSDNDRTDLVAFMKTLTDTEFLFNPRYGYPK